MSGAYTHITLENFLKEPMRLEAIPNFSEEAIIAVLDYFKFCELGAVSPDYPYLALDDSTAAAWGDAMHYTRTGEVIHAGINMLRNMKGDSKQKGLAWLLGYAGHVATDVTVHPVVEGIVGPYYENKNKHRICEMNMDAYIFQRLNLGDISLAEHLDSGIGMCSEPDDQNRLDTTVTTLWTDILRKVYPQSFKAAPPDIHKWHRRFKMMVGEIAGAGNILMPLARHVAAGLGLVYPNKNEIDMKYIEHLKTPESFKHFDEIFDRAIKSIEYIWSLVVRGIFTDDTAYLKKIGNWNLDTGRDESGALVFWKEKK